MSLNENRLLQDGKNLASTPLIVPEKCLFTAVAQKNYDKMSRQWIKIALDFTYLTNKFTRINDAKIKDWTFVAKISTEIIHIYIYITINFWGGEIVRQQISVHLVKSYIAMKCNVCLTF